MRVIDYLVKALYDAGVSTVLIPDASIGHPAKLTADPRDRFKDPVYIDDVTPDPTADEIEAILLSLGLKNACLGREGEKT